MAGGMTMMATTQPWGAVYMCILYVRRERAVDQAPSELWVRIQAQALSKRSARERMATLRVSVSLREMCENVQTVLSGQ